MDLGSARWKGDRASKILGRERIRSSLSPEALEWKLVDLLVSGNGTEISSPAAVRKFLRSLPIF